MFFNVLGFSCFPLHYMLLSISNISSSFCFFFSHQSGQGDCKELFQLVLLRFRFSNKLVKLCCLSFTKATMCLGAAVIGESKYIISTAKLGRKVLHEQTKSWLISSYGPYGL